jgi:hypothetical protein
MDNQLTKGEVEVQERVYYEEQAARYAKHEYGCDHENYLPPRFVPPMGSELPYMPIEEYCESVWFFQTSEWLEGASYPSYLNDEGVPRHDQHFNLLRQGWEYKGHMLRRAWYERIRPRV